MMYNTKSDINNVLTLKFKTNIIKDNVCNDSIMCSNSELYLLKFWKNVLKQSNIYNANSIIEDVYIKKEANL